MKTQSTRKAFSLLELKMVIAIMLFLLAAAIPMVSNYVGNARKTSDRQLLVTLNNALSDYKSKGGDLNALTSGKPFVNLVTLLKTPMSWYGLSEPFLNEQANFAGAITVDVSGSGKDYFLTRYNTYDEGGGSTILSGGEDITNKEFDISGATYYAVAEAGYSYSEEQTGYYSTRKYNTLAAAEAALPATLTTPVVINILGSWGSAMGGVTFAGTTTSPSNTILIRTLGDARHSGVWSNTAARLSGTNTMVLRFNYGNITVDGLQVELVANNATAYAAVYSGMTGITNHIKNMILRGNVASSTSNAPVGIRAHDGDIYAENCVIYDFMNGSNYGVGVLSRDSVFLSNSVIYNSGIGFTSSYGGGTVTNCAVFNNNDDFNNKTPSYCASDDGDGSNAVVPSDWDSVFIDISGRDFHLKLTDTDLKGAGTDLSGSFTTDIDGDTRSAPWSIGADQ